MTEEQKALLEIVAEELGGELYTVLVTDKYKEHKEIVIKYDERKVS
jgi:hypothetical protein